MSEMFYLLSDEHGMSRTIANKEPREALKPLKQKLLGDVQKNPAHALQRSDFAGGAHSLRPKIL